MLKTRYFLSWFRPLHVIRNELNHLENITTIILLVIKIMTIVKDFRFNIV